MNNPLKSQIAANRERFDEQFPWQNCCDSCVQDKNGRNYIGIEISKEYIDIINERISKLSAKGGIDN